MDMILNLFQEFRKNKYFFNNHAKTFELNLFNFYDLQFNNLITILQPNLSFKVNSIIMTQLSMNQIIIIIMS